MEFDLTRKYYEEVDYQPLIYYAIFGVEPGQIEISKEKYYVDNIPEGVQIYYVSKENDAELLKGFFGGSLGLVLYDDNHEVYDKSNAADNAVIISGNVKNAEDFSYMKNIIGIVEAFAENGAVGILDLLNFAFLSPSDWKNKFFEKEIEPQKHVTIFVSDDMDYLGKCWLHTRGLRKFGRPDLSIHNIAKEDVEEIKSIFDLLIDYAGRGAFFKNEIKVKNPNDVTYVLKSEMVNDFENSDFNNAYLELQIAGKE